MPTDEAKAVVVSQVQHWLEDIGLGRYVDVFARNRVDLDILPDLTEADLAELGVPLGDRKRLLRAISSLVDTMAVSDSAARPQRYIDRSRATGAAGRRQLTVMFCDLVGSTSLSEQFDPEIVRDMITSYRETCARVVEYYDGFVARYVGDGILVYFGYPNAHEDDAERAVLTALEIVRIVSTSTQSKESPGPLGVASAVRIGIATGLVVVGDVIGERTEEHDSVVGETPNLAARLQALAPPNCVVIAPSTHSLLKAKFEYTNLGSHILKGVSSPVQAWRVDRASRVESRFAASTSTGLTPLVNREEEIALLLMRWQEAKESDGQVVLLSGEPGIGKSRIIQEFCDRIASEPQVQLSFQCFPYYASTAFYLFIQQFGLMVGLDRESSVASSLRNLEAILTATTAPVEQVVPLFAALLSIPTGDQYKPLDLSPQRQKDDTVAALVNHLIGLARDRPALVIFEDAHWIDPSSREVLDLLVDRVQYASGLIIISCRPEFQPIWNAHSHLTRLTLNRLSRQLQATMVERVAGAKALPEEVVEEIIAKTDGVPLFVEELTKAVLELNVLGETDGQHAVSSTLRRLAIPATLADSLMARLDRMGRFKEVAQIGATIGREFPYELLSAVAETPLDQLNVALTYLEDAGLIIRRGHPPEAAYAFKHALVQDAAYSSLLHSERKKLHARIAAVLLEVYPERVEREPELLAQHFTEAGQSELAVEFWLKAGKRAAKARANLEAIGHLRRGLDVLAGNPAMRDHDRIELAMRLGLGIPLIAAKGYAVKELEENYLRALALGKQLGEEQETFVATRGLWVSHFIRADLARAQDLGGQLLKLAECAHGETAEQARQRTGYLIEAHRALGQTLLYCGRFVAARDHLERAIGLYDPNLHGSLIETAGIDSGVICLSYSGYLLWFLGCPDQARKRSDRALSDAERIGHPFTLAFALVFRAYLCQHLREPEGTRHHAQRALAIANEHGFLHWKHQATMLGGWASAELGQVDDGLSQIRAGLDAYEGMQECLACPWFRSLLANAYVKAGRPDAALRAVDDALAVTERTGERFFLAELYRLQGQITLAHRGPKAAANETEACYRRSLEVCLEQEALSWELRTAVSLARLWREVGKPLDAKAVLAPVYGRFKQGFDTLDLKEARQLMSELETH
jgi:class 3 adenylate cyclase/predicted ATPase